MRKSLLVLTCLLVSFAVVASFSCRKASQALGKKIAEKAIEGATGGKAKVDLGALGNVDISGLPEALRYPGAKAVGKFTVNDEKANGASYVFEVADPAATVVAFYKKAMAGWKSSMTSETGEATLLAYSSSDEKESAMITVAANKEKKNTALTIIYSSKK